MRDSNLIIISALLLLVGGTFRIIESFVEPNVGIVLQLIGTLSIIAAVGLLVVRSLQIIRRRSSPTKA